MRVLGIECASEEVSVVVLERTTAETKLLSYETKKAPAGYDRPRTLNWLRNEIQALLRKHSAFALAYKAAQKMPGRSLSPERAQFEGVIMEATYSHDANIKIKGLLTNQLKKLLGLKKEDDKSKLTDLVLDLNPDLPKKYHEAVQVALAVMQNG